jgi:transglutaminase-like putative cysteine protease
VTSSSLQPSLALLVALVFATSGMRVLLQGLDWWPPLILVCALMIGAAAITRTLTRRAWVPPLVNALVLLGTMTALFAPGTGFLMLIPTARTWATFGSTFDAAWFSIQTQSVPAIADEGITFLLVAGIGAIALLADLLAITLRAPALAGIPLLVILVVPALTTIDLSDSFSFILTAAAYLWLLRAGRPVGQRRLTLALGAGAVAVAIVLPILLPRVSAPSTPLGNAGYSTGVNPVLSLGRDLRQFDEHTVYTYSTSSGKPHYLRLVTLENFSGANWAPAVAKVDDSRTVNKLPAPPGLAKNIARKTETTDVRVGNLVSTWLPLPYPASSVSGLNGRWYWEPNALSVSSTDSTVNGQDYSVKSVIASPTPGQLVHAGTKVPSGFDKYLQLPADMPSIIPATAQRVAGSLTSNYAKALALQDFFRLGDFDYSEAAPVADGYDGTGVSVIAKFLTAKSGYCIHFASAMAVLARELGIPSRVAVGFLPGVANKENKGVFGSEFTVTSHDLHAWPELYFDGVGWIPFEPTPGRGVVPSYAVSDAALVALPNSVTPDITVPTGASTAGARPNLGALDGPNASTTAAGTGQSAWIGWLWAGGALLVLIVLGLAPAVARLAGRRRRLGSLRDNTAAPSVAWQEILDTAEDVGARPPDTATLRENAAVFDAMMGGPPQNRPGVVLVSRSVALERVLSAVEHEFYAEPLEEHASRQLAADVVEVTAALRSTLPRRAAFLARIAPASVWQRMLRVVGRRE